MYLYIAGSEGYPLLKILIFVFASILTDIDFYYLLCFESLRISRIFGSNQNE